MYVHLCADFKVTNKSNLSTFNFKIRLKKSKGVWLGRIYQSTDGSGGSEKSWSAHVK